MSIAPCQSLFVAPCSHVWHYKCIRPILNGHTWPNFLCPNCRAVADLEADVEEQQEEWEEDSIEAAIEASRRDSEPGPGAEDGEGTDGVRTPRAMEPLHDSQIGASRGGINGGGVSPTEVADDLTALSLDPLGQIRPPTPVSSPELEDEPTPSIQDPSNQGSVSALAAPRPIPARTTGSASSYELAVGPLVHEGPMTPRNDAGPFVLDGGAGTTTAGDGRIVGRTTGSLRRGAGGSSNAGSGLGSLTVQSLDATAAEVGLGHV